MHPINETVSQTTNKVKIFVESRISDISQSNRTYSFSDLLTRTDFHDRLEGFLNAHSEIRNIQLRSSIDNNENLDNYIREHAISASENKSISELRLIHGFRAGLIDLNTEALMLTDKGWASHKGEIVANKDASFEDISSICESYSSILPTFTAQDLKRADEIGKLYIRDKLVAEKVNPNAPDGLSNDWYIFSQDRVLTGFPDRVLHHQDEPVYIVPDTMSLSQGMYHAGLFLESDVANDAVSLNAPNEHTFGISVPGNGVYLANLDEVVKKFGNGISLARQHMKEYIVDNIDPNYTNENRQGVVFKGEVDLSLSIYDANYNDGTYMASSTAKPSPYAIMAVINNSSHPNQEILKLRAISDLSCAENPFEVYRCIERLSHEITNQGKSPSPVIPTIFASMGYDSVKITPPTKAQRASLKELREDFMNDDGELWSEFKYYCKEGNPNSTRKQFINYSSNLLSGVSGAIENSHLVIYSTDKEKVKFIEKLALPKHTYFTCDNKLESLESDPVFSQDNGKNYDSWDLKRLNKYIESTTNKSMKREITNDL